MRCLSSHGATFLMANGLAAIAVTAVLSGCAGTTMQDVLRDREGYLESNFTPDQASPAVRASLAGLSHVDLPFKTLQFDMDVAIHKTDTRSAETADLTESVQVLVRNAGSGYVQTVVDTSNNGIPVYLVMSLDYLNLIGLRSEDVSYGLSKPGPFAAFDSLDTWQGDFGHPPEDAVLSVNEHAHGVGTHFACATRRYHPARDIHPALAGRALDMTCTSDRDGVVFEKDDEVFLDAYGIYMVVGRQLSYATYRFTVTDCKAS